MWKLNRHTLPLLIVTTLLNITMVNVCVGQIQSTNNAHSVNGKGGYRTYFKYGWYYEVHLQNGALDGIYKVYYKNRTLYCIGMYKAGKEVGTWYYFDEKGRLFMEISRIEHKQQIDTSGGVIVTFDTKAYFKFYYPNGICKEEGFAIYDDPEMHITKIGKWKEYNEKGKRLR